MKTHIKHTFIIGALGFCLAACSDFLDEKGYNTDYSYYETADGIETLVASSSRRLVRICIPLVVMAVLILLSTHLQ